MKKVFWVVVSIIFLGACGSGASKSEEMSGKDSASDLSKQSEVKTQKRGEKMGKSIIVYYSLTENTKAAAEEIQKQIAGDLLRIETKEPYPESYDEVLDVVRAQRAANELPQIISQEIDLAEYDSIFLGTPIWFGEPALPVEKWLSENNLENTTIYPFFTSGSSSIYESMARYKELLPQSNLSDGLGISSSDKSRSSSLIKEWLADLE